MGDVIHALPAAFDIKQALPEAQLDWVIEESFRDVTDLSPFIDNTIVTAFRRWRKYPLSAVTRREVSDLRHLLTENHYDIVIDLQGLIRTALIARWCGVKSVGYSKTRSVSLWQATFIPKPKRCRKASRPFGATA